MNGTQHGPKSKCAVYKNAAVSSDSKICSDIGRDILQLKGGNAVDAAVASCLASGIVYPHSTGIGGGFYAILYSKKHGWWAVDGKETCPAKITPQMFVDREGKEKAKRSGVALCVPSLIKGLLDMHSRFGSLPWKMLVEPTIQLLRWGNSLSKPSYGAAERELVPRKDELEGFESFFDENGTLKSPGSVINQPELLKTMEIVAVDPMSMYQGSLAKDIIQDVQEKGGVMQLEDLTTYRTRIQETLKTEMPRGKVIHSHPAPSGGPSLNYILSIMAGYNPSPNDMSTTESQVLTTHRILEASRFALARNTQLGDPEFVEVETLVEKMASRSYGDSTRKLINDNNTQKLEDYGPVFRKSKSSGTAHISILDQDGNAVSITSSINKYYGSCIVGKRTGIIFNDQMADFSHYYHDLFDALPTCPANMVEPGKRPNGAMCPVIVWDNNKCKVCLIAGAAGKHRIPSCLAKAILDVLYYKTSINNTLDLPRVYADIVPMTLRGDENLPQEIKDGLIQKGHQFDKKSVAKSVIEIVHVTDEGDIVAGTDYRKGGEPSGY